MRTNHIREVARLSAAIDKVQESGFESIGNWLFRKNGVTYDLSAADLDRVLWIEHYGMFIVAEEIE